ncbi:pre-mRNA-processing ATP-dependent RNA helicase PRP5-like [Coccinella septempunctata]|uniref:pre-mRNA-processing ATP-dependent RNA helicase PRP5-like n=1 Tax=Coccinella septempunctata TaxID=41139 RepID=UPI001D066485|nr:pre-mRNA-processing ATP-dependent RNA helicase PRP5-like [Coccinella septempunctata]
MDENIIAHDIDDTRTKDVLIEENVSFQSMFLPQKCLAGLNKCGFQTPSPIQLKALPLGRCGFDLIVKSKSGTGKTMVFSLVALESIDLSLSSPQVLVLAPTREIAVQIAKTIKALGYWFAGLKVSTFIGGFPEKDDIGKAHNCQIAVGAPGRIKSLIEKNILDVNSVKLFVLDEADKLMETSFLKDVNDIYKSLPQKKQIITTSATYPNNLENFLSKYMQAPTCVSSENETQLLLGLKQFIKEVQPSTTSAQEIRLKNEEVHKLLSSISFTQCIIFSNFQTRAENICISLKRYGWESMFISGAQTQQKRLETMEKLKNFKCRILISTDLTARGIDASNIDLVINFDVPLDVSTYLHRMGRAGRFGSRGICISLVSGAKDLFQIRKYLGNIGGPNFTISKLGNIENGGNDLWLEDESKFERISGIVGRNEEAIDAIKDEVLSFKICSGDLGKTTDSQSENTTNNHDDLNRKLTENVSTTSKSSDENESSLIAYTEDVGYTVQSVTERIGEKNAPVKETDSLLQSLAEGKFNFETIPTTSMTLAKKEDSAEKNVDNISLKALAEGTFDFSNVPSPSNIFSGKFNETVNSDSSIKQSLDVFMKLEKDQFLAKIEKKEPPEEDNIKALLYLAQGYEDYEKFAKTRKSSELDPENNAKMPKNEVYIKNKGIYEVARILHKDIEANPEMEKNLKNYLNMLEEETKGTRSTVVQNEVKPIQSDVPHNSLTEKRSEINTGNIFDCAYLQTIEKEKNNWKNFVDYDGLQPINQMNTENIEENDSSNFSEKEDEEDSEQDQPLYDENGYENIPNRMVWVPVEEGASQRNNQINQVNLLDGASNENNSISMQVDEPNSSEQNKRSVPVIQLGDPNSAELYHEHFSDLFHQCSSELWKKGLTFTSAEEFDQWYTRHWLKRLDDVREYVQRNVMVSEMSLYQGRRKNT